MLIAASAFCASCGSKQIELNEKEASVLMLLSKELKSEVAFEYDFEAVQNQTKTGVMTLFVNDSTNRFCYKDSVELKIMSKNILVAFLKKVRFVDFHKEARVMFDVTVVDKNGLNTRVCHKSFMCNLDSI